jgi:hypothetical protein
MQKTLLTGLLNMGGLFLDLAGAIILAWYWNKTRGILAGEWQVAYAASGKGQWYLLWHYLGWISLAGGFFLQLLGHFMEVVL